MALNGMATRRLYSRGNLGRYLAVPSLRLSVSLHPRVVRRSLHESKITGTRGGDVPVAQSPESAIQKHGRHVLNQEFVKNMEEYKKNFSFPLESQKEQLEIGKRVIVHGFLSRRRVKHSKLVFADLTSNSMEQVQISSAVSGEEDPSFLAHKDLRAVPLHTPVAVTGLVTEILRHGTQPGPIDRYDLKLESIQVLNPFPKDIIVSEGVRFPPTSRHLQIRFSHDLRQRLTFRADVAWELRKHLRSFGFLEVETPMLFKSTPEGAREFLVPSRTKGLVYALPQSPQQYKQLLMASGVGKYYQFARCFRDEDLRADRQPEFTQLDLELAFATGKDVMRTVEGLIRLLCDTIKVEYTIEQQGDELFPVRLPRNHVGKSNYFRMTPDFPRITYQKSMEKYGSDKPDLRIPYEIHRIESILPQSFVSMITGLKDHVVEATKIRLNDNGEHDRVEGKKSFIRNFMDNLPASLAKNPDGAPAVLVVDSSKPLQGLSSLGHEGFENLTSGRPGLETFGDLTDGDIIIVPARETKPFHSGSTALGNLRTALYHEAVAQGLLPRDDTLHFLWVTGFPMFTPDSDKGADPGQGGRAGFSATHHPFTAPLTEEDFDLLATDPLRAKADHYDLVVNGVELGGGSRRIHVAKVQEYVMRDILKMTDEGVGQFAHLLEALRAGCPPHAGFALGFDRLVAVLSGTNSVRDVIAFPKSMKGEDLMVKAPGLVTEEQLETYHLKLRE